MANFSELDLNKTGLLDQSTVDEWLRRRLFLYGFSHALDSHLRCDFGVVRYVLLISGTWVSMEPFTECATYAPSTTTESTAQRGRILGADFTFARLLYGSKGESFEKTILMVRKDSNSPAALKSGFQTDGSEP